MLYERIDYFRTSALSKILTKKNKALKECKRNPNKNLNKMLIEMLKPEIEELKLELAKRRKADKDLK